MEDLTLKEHLRDNLRGRYTESELRQWFDPLCITKNSASPAAEDHIEITFPHFLFARRFPEQVKESFITQIKNITSNNCAVYFSSGANTPVNETAPGKNNINSSVTYSDVKNGIYGNQYSFDNFIVNSKNKFSLDILRQTATNDRKYNQIVLYGSSGSGKTHLLHALYNDIVKHQTEKIPVFCGTTDTIADMLSKGKYHRLSDNSGIIIDDIHQIRLFPNIYENLTRLIDQFINARKLFICSTHLQPTQWEIFPSSLHSRLDQALIIRLDEADMDIRLRYAQSQNKEFSLGLSREQMLYIAQKCPTLRKITGIMQRVSAFRNFKNSDLINIQQIISDSVENEKLSPHEIISVVALRFGVSSRDMLSARRQPKIAQARQIAMYLSRELLGSSYPALGKFFNNRDHSTVLYAIKKIHALCQKEQDMNNLVTELKILCQKRNKQTT